MQCLRHGHEIDRARVKAALLRSRDSVLHPSMLLSIFNLLRARICRDNVSKMIRQSACRLTVAGRAIPGALMFGRERSKIEKERCRVAGAEAGVVGGVSGKMILETHFAPTFLRVFETPAKRSTSAYISA